LVFGLFAACLWTTTAWATTPETESQIDALERDDAEIKGQSQAIFSDCNTCPPDINCNTCPPDIKFEVGAELTLLDPQIGSLVLHNFIQDQFKVTPDYDLNAAYRVWIGRQSSNGLGWRIALWKFDDTATVEFPQQVQNAALTSNLNLYTIDIELTHQLKLCTWDISSSIGVRIGGIGTDEMFRMGNNVGSFDENFTGGGLTFSIGTKQVLGSSNWSVYGGFRGSLIYGVTKFNMSAAVNQVIHFDGQLEGSVLDQTVSILELQLGLQYERCTRFGLFFGRLGVETQLWELPPLVAGIGDQNVGLLGPTFCLGLRR
jgi:hypothetical protein